MRQPLVHNIYELTKIERYLARQCVVRVGQRDIGREISKHGKNNNYS